MAAKKAPPRRTGRKGYYEGGPVISNNSLGNSITNGFTSAVSMGLMAKKLNDDDAKKKKPDPNDPNAPIPSDAQTTDALGQGLYSRGGRIKHTSGPRIGKDDGLIPAQRGEFVVRKSAVNKLGTKALNSINKGRIPPRKGMR